MTIRLLAKHGKYPANSIVTLDAGTEAGLIAANLATATLTGGTPYVEPTVPNGRYSVQVEAAPNGSAVGLVGPRGQLLRLNRAVSGVLSHRPGGGRSSNIDQTANATIANNISCPRDFIGIRVMYENYNTDNPMTFIGTAAASPNKTFARSPELTFNRLKFGGADSVVIPAATKVRTDTGTARAQVTPSRAWSDFLPLQSLPRTDEPGADRILQLRTHSPAGAISGGPILVNNPGWVETGDYIAYATGGGDHVTTPTSTILPGVNGSGQVILPYGEVHFYTGGETCRILAVGDSQTQGSPDNTVSWPTALRAQMRRLGFPNISVTNAGVGGQKRDVTSDILRGTLAEAAKAGIKYDIVVIWDESVNSNGDYPAGGQMQFMARDLEAIRAHGAKPVVVTQHAATAGAAEVAAAARTRDYLAGTDVTLLDFAAVLATSPSNQGVNPAYVQPDLRHHNAAGVAVLAEYAAPLLLGLV